MSNVIFLVETYRIRIQNTCAALLAANVTKEEIQDTGEEI